MIKFFIKIIKNIFTTFVRACDYIISGRKEFSITTDGFDEDKYPFINNLNIGKKLLSITNEYISDRYSIVVINPVVLELVKSREKDFLNFTWKEENLGKYHSQKMINEKYHMIYIMSGLPIKRFKAIIAHELMHAFLYEQKIFTDDQPCREAMARWIEYKILKDLHSKKDIEHILKIKSLKHGSGFKEILKIKKKARKKPLVRFLIENKEEALNLQKAINNLSK